MKSNFFSRIVILALLLGGVLPVATAANLRIEVNPPQSNLSLNLAGVATHIGSIRGQIHTDVTTTAQVYVNSSEIVLTSGAQSFRAHLSGTIGGRPISTAPVFMPVSPGAPLLIDLQFTVPQGQFRSGVAPAGNYLATPVLIYAIAD